MIVQWNKGQKDESTNVWPPDIGGRMPTINLTLEITVDPYCKQIGSSGDSPIPDIGILKATAFNDLLSSDENIKAFAQ
jgi:hypothetical protein